MAFSASTANIQALAKKTIDERNLKSKRKNSSSSVSYSNLEELRRIGSSSSLDTRDVESLTTNNKKLMTPAKIFYRRKLGVNRSPFNIQSALFVIIGVLTGFILANLLRQSLLNCKNSNSCCPYSYESNVVGSELKRGGEMMDEPSSTPNHIYTNIEESKRLVFIGVMTAQKYLDTRAKSVFETWGQAIPGKMSFFSRSGSSSQYKIPLVSLPGVDDSYPPQKKSFMMLKFMHDNYLEKFEWFMRVDDDVYIRPDKLELFLRSINSSKPQFIGQAGLGNEKEFGLLSLDYDENFCMGGPGIVMSRETLRLVVPHISYCLKNLYSTHEDVEIGRCVRKFANVSCTWAYEMQNIFHHNSSGNQAYSGELLSREVLRAVSLHPIKRSKYQYRVHNFFNQRKIHDLRHRKLELRRRTFELKRDLLTYESNRTTTTTTTTTTKLMMEDRDDKPIEVEEGVFESVIFNRRAENLSLDLLSNRFDLRPVLNWQRAPVKKRQHRHDFEFFTRSLFSPGFISPKRGLEGFWKKALAETVRQLMDDINKNSIERGRIIDFKDILYGYMRDDPLIGVDYILDILLVYRKYEGRKMTVQVRRHAYVRNTYTSAIVRENDLSSSIFIPYPPPSSEQSIKTSDEKRTQNSGRLLKRLLPNFLLKYLNTSNDQDNSNNDNSLLDFDDPKALEINRLEKMRITSREEIYIDKKASEKWVNFVVPLTGRWEIFKRFMRNYERVCIERGERTRLVVVLFENEATKPIEDDANQGKFYAQSYLISSLFRRLRAKYAIDDPKSLLLVVNGSDFSRSIGCEIGAAQFSLDSLIFFVDVDMVFTTEFLMRARLNTIQYKQVYYPIVYSEYDPDDTVEAIRSLVNDNKPTANGSVKSPLKMREKPLDSHFDFNQESGYWRQFGFGIVSVYNSDLRLVGGFDTKIIGWGKEDVDLYEKFIASNITVFRAVDVGLVHVFHKIECDPKLADEQMIMCLGSKATSIASQRQLARLILRNKALLKTVTEYNFTTTAPSTTTFKPDGKTTTNLN